MKLYIISMIYQKISMIIIHEENTKEVSTMSAILYAINFFSKFVPDFHGLDNVDLSVEFMLNPIKHCCSCLKIM